MTCSPDLVPKCHIPWGQASILKHCCPNNLSPPYFSLLNCRHLLEFCHSAIWYDWCRSYKEGIFSEAKTISKLPQIVAWEHYKTSSTKCSISQNKLTKKTNKYILHKTLADGYAVYLWHLLGNPWAGITFPPKEVTTDASGCICVSKWTNGWEFIWEADLLVFVSGGMYQLNQNRVPGALNTNTASRST